MTTAATVNDIVAAKTMPVEAGATDVFDLGYYDYAWWAKLDAADCRIVTRFEKNMPSVNVRLRLKQFQKPPPLDSQQLSLNWSSI
jgi:hypothetical protein